METGSEVYMSELLVSKFLNLKLDIYIFQNGFDMEDFDDVDE